LARDLKANAGRQANPPHKHDNVFMFYPNGPSSVAERSSPPPVAGHPPYIFLMKLLSLLGVDPDKETQKRCELFVVSRKALVASKAG
jgi:hypothetical protein